MPASPQYVRCLDNSLVRNVLKNGRIYECKGEQDGNYFVTCSDGQGKWLGRGRFRAATAQEWVEQANAAA